LPLIDEIARQSADTAHADPAGTNDAAPTSAATAAALAKFRALFIPLPLRMARAKYFTSQHG
jgi:hypothetical protein